MDPHDKLVTVYSLDPQFTVTAVIGRFLTDKLFDLVVLIT